MQISAEFKFSAQPQTMPKAYSEDLRWRAVWLHLIRGMSYTDVAQVLFMCEKSVQRYLALFYATGNVAPHDQKRGPDKKLTEFELFTILQSLIIKPTSFLCEIQQQLLCSTGKWVHASTICRTIREQGLTRKKVRTIALQQSESRRIEYMAEVSVFHPDMLIWIDETGSDRRNSIRKYGYSLRGMPAQVFQLRVGGKRISAIPVLTTRGIEDVYTSKETINGERFEEFLCQCVLPIIMPYDGVNPRSVVVMDNASIHHLERVQDMITGVGARLVFLPPYSPDLMPLEEVFAEVKALLRAIDSIYLASTTPELMVKLAFTTMTQENCLAYIQHAGYM